MKWIIPSPEWSAEMRLIMETHSLSMNAAFRLLNTHGTADAVFEHLTA